MEEGKSGDGDSYTNVKRVYDSDDEMWAENRSKRLHDPLLMKNKNVVEQKKKTEEIYKKKGQEKLHMLFPDPHFLRYVF
ncbi:hypothetical protein EJD97_006918, partial [Solanum chilense]